jgi:formylmethanofuran dehydrogenase subunit E
VKLKKQRLVIQLITQNKNNMKDEPLFMCNSCHEHFPREEMDFDVDDDQDLCKTCNFVSYNDAPYGENDL